MTLHAVNPSIVRSLCFPGNDTNHEFGVVVCSIDPEDLALMAYIEP
jgi:Na+-transporting NADH:ubiquinone oxidoreductase subunit NqrA